MAILECFESCKITEKSIYCFTNRVEHLATIYEITSQAVGADWGLDCVVPPLFEEIGGMLAVRIIASRPVCGMRNDSVSSEHYAGRNAESFVRASTTPCTAIVA